MAEFSNPGCDTIQGLFRHKDTPATQQGPAAPELGPTGQRLLRWAAVLRRFACATADAGPAQGAAAAGPGVKSASRALCLAQPSDPDQRMGVSQS